MKSSASKFLILFLFLGLLHLQTSVLKAQESKKDAVYEFADVMPKFNGDYAQYLAENLNYPKEATDNNIQGTVYAELTIDKNGKVNDVYIKKDIGAGCGKEVKRVLLEMPNWEPGMQNGKKVAVRMTIPVKFVLTNGREKKKDKKRHRIGEDE